MNSIAVSTAIQTGRRDLVNVRTRSLLMAKWRVLWVVLGFAAIALTAVLRIAFLGLFSGLPSAADLAAALQPQRGDITDRNGVPLARAFPAYSLWFNPAALGGDGPPLVHTPAEVAAALGRIFPDLDVTEMTRRLAEGKPGYLRRRIMPEDANK
ncbi:MAG: penicillin-binding protein 2, partial [Novosphingobium sp.]